MRRPLPQGGMGTSRFRLVHNVLLHAGVPLELPLLRRESLVRSLCTWMCSRYGEQRRGDYHGEDFLPTKVSRVVMHLILGAE